jgi:hypothetical protein
MAFTDSQTGGQILGADLDTTREVLLAGSVNKGDAVGYASGWKRALATAGTAIQQKATALMDGQSGERIPACFGKVMIGGRFAGGTIGAKVYAAEGADNGKYTETAPTDSGDCNKVTGVVVDTDTIVVDPNANVDSVA